MHGRRCHPPGVSDKRIQCTSSPTANHASVTRQGRFRHPSAKKDTIRCTQGAFHQQISLIEACSAPSSTLSPVWNKDTSCAFSILVQSSTLTEGRSTKTRPSQARRHECRANHKAAAPLPTSASRTVPRPATNKSAVPGRRRVPRSPALRPANLVPGTVPRITPRTGLARCNRNPSVQPHRRAQDRSRVTAWTASNWLLGRGTLLCDGSLTFCNLPCQRAKEA
jgi:hypothetical protein